jgi:hypothetical protein
MAMFLLLMLVISSQVANGLTVLANARAAAGQMVPVG